MPASPSTLYVREPGTSPTHAAQFDSPAVISPRVERSLPARYPRRPYRGQPPERYGYGQPHA